MIAEAALPARKPNVDASQPGVVTPAVCAANSSGQTPASIAYLSDPEATGGAASLFIQKAAVDALAWRLGRTVSRYVIDSGRGDDPTAIGDNLAALLRASAGMSGGTILVAGISRLDHRPVVARALMQRFEGNGLSVVSAEASPSTAVGHDDGLIAGRSGCRSTPGYGVGPTRQNSAVAP